jgi:type II secretory pathway pseudopilin PulG
MRNPTTVARQGQRAGSAAAGFSLLELAISAAILLVVLGTAMNFIRLATQSSKREQTTVDLTQQGRAFVDEFERDIHQAGYPNCRMFNTTSNCSAHFADGTMAVGIAQISNTNIIFEGDVNGDGVVETVQYQLVDSAGNSPPSGTCPCTLQRSEMPKVSGTAPLAQPTSFSQELQNIVNSGVPAAGQPYGGGLPIAGNVLFANGSQTNTAYYAAVTTFKDFPVFSAYDQNGALITLPVDISTVSGQQTLGVIPSSNPSIKSIRLTINLLASGTTGYDLKTGVRPVMTLTGNGRLNN